MKNANAMIGQLYNLGMTGINGLWTQVRIRDKYPGGPTVRLFVEFERDDDGVWNGQIWCNDNNFHEKWDGEQPIEKWLERMEKAYWDV